MSRALFLSSTKSSSALKSAFLALSKSFLYCLTCVCVWSYLPELVNLGILPNACDFSFHAFDAFFALVEVGLDVAEGQFLLF